MACSGTALLIVTVKLCKLDCSSLGFIEYKTLMSLSDVFGRARSIRNVKVQSTVPLLDMAPFLTCQIVQCQTRNKLSLVRFQVLAVDNMKMTAL
jgi:hypothetical protein